MTVTLSFGLQAITIVGVAAIFATLARRPSVRHALWTAGVVGSLLLPVAALVLPTIRVTQPEFIRTTLASVAPEREMPSTPIAPPALEPPDGLRLVAETPASIDRDLLVWMVWALGAIAFLLLVIRRALRVRTLLRGAKPVTSQTVLDEWAALLGRYSMNQKAAILASTADPAAPATCGLLRSRVLLPAHHDSWSRERVSAVLAHELAHVARRDCLTQTAAQVASAIYWFSPLHRYAERRMAMERERACDELVLRAGLSPRSYATALVDAERDAVDGAAPASLVLAMASPVKSELEHRVEHILEGEPERAMGLLARLAVASLTAAVVVVTSSVRLEAALPGDVRGVPPSQGMEPDQRRDSVALPSSERIPSGVLPADAVVRAAIAGPDSALAMQLVHALEREPQGDEDLVRDRARWALMQSANGSLVDPLLGRLAADDWRVRAYAAWTLGLARDPRATPSLVAQMDHPVWRLRAMAASALEAIGDVRARDAMVRALGDEAWQVRSAAVSYLGALNEPALTPLIRARLSDRHVAVRMAAQRALTG